MRPDPVFRIANQQDYDSLGELMFDAVRNSHNVYTTEQRKAWAPQINRGKEWSERLSTQAVFVAELEKKLVGFVSLAECGYIDLAFIRPKHQGQGLFRSLYNRLEQTARERGEVRLWVHASIMAQSAFGAVGFAVVQEQLVELRGQALRRFEMEKHL